ncbi:hypothetical protein MMC18_000100 [Xylographa bjoerkii]|nr:hypothetical protein [Xylographa bjoerkii]
MYLFWNDQEEAARAALQALRNRTQVKRASILRDPYASLVLNRQTGLLSPQFCATSGSIWAHHATRRQFLDIREQIYTAGDVVVTAVAKDEATGTIFIAFNANDLHACVESWPPRHVHLQEDEYPISSRKPLLFRYNTEISSLCFSPDRKLCSTTLEGTIHINDLLPPEIIADSTYPIVTSDVQTAIVGIHNDTVWSSDCSPASDLAVGTSGGMRVLSLDTEQWSLNPLTEHKDILAVHWSSKHILLGGSRKGTVWRTDQRVPATERLIRHPSSVTGLKMLDEHRVVVAGMINQLFTYDTRFLHPIPTTALQQRPSRFSGPDPRHISTHDSRRVPGTTAPYIEYRNYHNAAHPNLGFDVSRELGLVAAATDEGDVKIWDGWTGKERVWGKGRYDEEEDRGAQQGESGRGDGRWRRRGEPRRGNGKVEGGELVRSLVFAGGGGWGGRGRGDSLLVARGGVVEEWGL